MLARARKRSTAHPLLSDIDWLRPRWEGGATIAEIAEEAGADVSTVHLWLRRHELPARKHDIDRADLEKRLGRGDTIASIAAHYEVDPAVIYDRMYRWGLAAVDTGDYDVEQLRRWYARGWSTHRIAAELGASRRTVTRLLLAAGVTLRPPGRRPRD